MSKRANQANLEGLSAREREVGILMKLNLRDRVRAVIFAYETGLNQPAR